MVANSLLFIPWHEKKLENTTEEANYKEQSFPTSLCLCLIKIHAYLELQKVNLSGNGAFEDVIKVRMEMKIRLENGLD